MNRIKIVEKVVVLLLAFVILLAMAPLSFLPAYGASRAEVETNDGATLYSGKDCTSDATAAATIDYIMEHYKHGSEYPNGGECYGYAEKVSKLLAGKRSYKTFTGLQFTKENFLKYCKGIKAGAHLRVSNSRTFNGGWGHSIVLLKVSGTGTMFWADNNSGGVYNHVHYYKGSIDDFFWQYGFFRYINRVTWTNTYRIADEPSLACDTTNGGSTYLTWLKTRSTKEYKVYRSKFKLGKYYLIKTTQAKKYIDKSGVPGVKYYYKVKSVKSGGYRMSNTVSGVRHLARPVARTAINSATGLISLSWKSVPKTNQYSIYRTSPSTGKYVYIKTVISDRSTVSFTDTQVTKPGWGNYYSYKVKALYKSNPKGNSKLSYETIGKSPEFAQSSIISVTSNRPGEITLNWAKVKWANKYTVRYSRDWNEEDYELYAGNELGASIEGLGPGTYFIKIQAFNEDYTCPSESKEAKVVVL